MSLEPSERAGAPSFAPLRHCIEGLADPDGRFRVACAKCGVCPVPVDGLAFPGRETAVLAARLATRYRALLGEFDANAPAHALVVHDGPPRVANPDGGTGQHTEPV